MKIISPTCPNCGKPLMDCGCEHQVSETEGAATDANSIQHGGNHYKLQAIQVWDYVTSNNIPYLEGNVIKYISRWRSKNGMEDLLKAKHYLEKVIENEKLAQGKS